MGRRARNSSGDERQRGGLKCWPAALTRTGPQQLHLASWQSRRPSQCMSAAHSMHGSGNLKRVVNSLEAHELAHSGLHVAKNQHGHGAVAQL